MDGLWNDLVAPTISGTVGAGVGALLGALLGARSAFKAERIHRAARLEDERRERAKHIEDKRVTATNLAIFTLARIFVEVDGYRRNNIDPQRDKPDSWYNLGPILMPPPPAFDTASLSYLFEQESNEAKNLPMEVSQELKRYFSIYRITHERNQIQLNEAQPAIEQGMRTIEGALQMSLDQVLVHTMGGHRVLKTLQQLTAEQINMVDAACESIPGTAHALRKIAKAQYPDRVIIKFELARKDTALQNS